MSFSKKFGTVLSLSLMGFQALAIPALCADTSVANAPTQEETLLANLIVLKGEGLSQDQLQAQAGAELSQYLATAQQDGKQLQRMSDALVTLKVYTQAQTDRMITDAQTTSASLAKSGQMTNEAAVKATFQQFISLHPAGAQFSGCDVENPLGIVLLAGGVTGIIYAFVRFNQLHSSGLNSNDASDVALEWGGAGFAAAIAGAILLGEAGDDYSC